MGRVYWAIRDILIALLFLTPIFLVYWKYVFHDIKRSIIYLVFAMYLVSVYSLVGLPSVLYLRFDFGYNFIPFVGMAGSAEESLLNVLLFVPLGFFLPVLCERYQEFKHTILFGLLTTVGIELLQIFTFRAMDINDIITNVTGTVIGYMIAQLITGKFMRLTLKEKSGKYIYLTLTTAFVVMFFMVCFVKKILGEF